MSIPSAEGLTDDGDQNGGVDVIRQQGGSHTAYNRIRSDADRDEEASREGGHARQIVHGCRTSEDEH